MGSFIVLASLRTSVWGPQVTKQQGNSYRSVAYRPFVVDMSVLVELFLVTIVNFHIGETKNKWYVGVNCLNAALTVFLLEQQIYWCDNAFEKKLHPKVGIHTQNLCVEML